MTVHTDICIIGAGLSGLALAAALRAEGRVVLVIEARDRPGGRVLSPGGHDLGPSWVWSHNRRMLALLDRLGLRHFPQHASGRLVFEDATGAINRDMDFATMAGALRVEGGLARVTDALAAEVDDGLRLSCPVQRVAPDRDGVTVTAAAGTIRADRVVLALPPRLAAGLGVPVPDVPTWMAGQGRCCRTLTTEDSLCESSPLDALHEQAITRPLSHDELVQLQRVAAQAGIFADLGRQGHDVACAA